MDPATLTAFLAPFLPALLNLGAKAASGAATKAGETAGTKLTENALNKAIAVWEKLFPKVKAKEDAKIAAEQVAPPNLIVPHGRLCFRKSWNRC